MRTMSSSPSVAIAQVLAAAGPLCVPCVATRVGLSEVETDTAVEVVSGVLRVFRERARCHECGNVTDVFSLAAMPS